MSIHIISNQHIQVTIAEKGAELQSIYNKATALEYLWDANPVFWSKKSPVLFPIVGGLKNNTYFFEDKSYQLSRHGFARDAVFTVTNQSENSITFSIQATEATLAIYPFHFKFSVVYELLATQLKVSYAVKNTDTQTMYFSVGAHPAFKIPLVENTSFSDYYLQFSSVENVGRWPLSADGLIEKKSITLLNNSNQLPLSKALFYGDALVFKQLQSNKITIASNQTKHGLSIQFDDFPYMGIWSAKDADFVCIEPWCGIADSVDTTQQLTEKEGINTLHANEIFEVSWLADFF